MPLAVGNISNQVHVLTLGSAQQAVYCLYYNFYYVDVLPLIETADVVCVGRLAIVEDEVNGTSVVLHIEPVAHVLALAIDRKRLLVTDVVDK